MRSPLLTALFHPLHQAMLLLAAAAGLLAAWWLFPAGLGLWLIMVLRMAGDRSIRTSFDMQARAGTLSTRFQEFYNRVVQSQTRINNFLLSAGGRTKRALEPVQAEVELLTNGVYDLCLKMTAPENYLKVTKMNSDLEGERALLTLSLETATDPMIRREKEEALHALDDRMKKIKEIERMLNRVEAQLASTAEALDSVLADIMRLQALGGAQTEKEVPKVVQQLRAQLRQLKASEAEAAGMV
jgi:hypothetical protein